MAPEESKEFNPRSGLGSSPSGAQVPGSKNERVACEDLPARGRVRILMCRDGDALISTAACAARGLFVGLERSGNAVSKGLQKSQRDNCRDPAHRARPISQHGLFRSAAAMPPRRLI